MTEFRADLHCHSTYSDGSLSPLELIQLAIKKGLQGLSITDHDTIGAYPEAIVYGQQHHVTVIPGIEFSASHNGKPVHILGYAFDLNSPSIRALCNNHKTRRQQRNQAMMDRLAALEMPIDNADLPTTITGGTIGRPHIASAMMKRGYVTSVQEAFKKYLREGGAAYVPGSRITIEETIQAIHDAKGLAVIAHPHLVADEQTITYLFNMPFDGIEAYYCLFPLDRCQRWLKAAQKRDWFITGGSDFHGDVKPNIPLGASWTPEATFQRLCDHHKQVNERRDPHLS